MSDMLKKKKQTNESRTGKKDLRNRRVTTSAPKNTYDPTKEPANSKKKTSTNRTPTTTVRVTSDTREKLQALTILRIGDSIDEVISIMIEEYIPMLSEEEKKEYSLIHGVISQKRRSNDLK